MNTYDENEHAINVDLTKKIRCSSCHRVLILGELAFGSAIQVKCPRCKREKRIGDLIPEATITK